MNLFLQVVTEQIVYIAVIFETWFENWSLTHIQKFKLLYGWILYLNPIGAEAVI